MDDRKRSLERRLYRQMKATCEAYRLLAPGDRVLVALSGGKDSYTMLHLLRKLAPRLPFSVELVAVHLDQRQPGYDGAPLRGWLEAKRIPHEILSEDTYSVVKGTLPEGATYCSLCSRLRRGILYTAAARLRCNKIALGHHRDDALETLLMNLFYAGRLQAMPALYRTNGNEFDVIRPLIECPEALIAELASLEAFPILPCSLCGSQDGLKREAMKALLDQIERESPRVRNVMMNALRNVRPTHLLDRDVQQAWDARPTHIRPEHDAEPRVERFDARPVRRLPVV